MEQVTSAAETLFSTAHPDIKKTTDISSVLISVSLCVAGAVVLLYSLKTDDASSVLGPLSLVCGSLLVIAGLIRLLKGSKHLVYAPTGSVVKKGSRFLSADRLSDLREILETKDFASPKGIAVKTEGNARLDYMASRDRRFAAVQLSRYVPYTYETASSIFYYTGNEAEAFLDNLQAGNF